MDAATLRILGDLGDHIAAGLPQAVISSAAAHGELSVMVHPDQIVSMLAFLRKDPNCRFRQLIDITAVDYPQRDLRFDVVYHLLSVHHNHRIRVKAQIAEDAVIPSAVSIFPCANWYEREMFDMFGIAFTGHPDMRRILTDYGFEGYPLRKDFPLTGFVQVRYDDERKQVVNEPVHLSQEFRSFDFLSPWEGAEYALPGDEKASTPMFNKTGGKS